MSTYSLEGEEFDSILKDMEDETLCPDLGETAPSTVSLPTEGRQVLVAPAVFKRSYGVL